MTSTAGSLPGPTALALENISGNIAARHGADWNLRSVSYWEWVKLIGTAFLISSATTVMGLAMWWLIK